MAKIQKVISLPKSYKSGSIRNFNPQFINRNPQRLMGQGLNPQQGTYNPQRTIPNFGGTLNPQSMKIKSMKKGGKVKKTGIYKLHKGEKVITKKGHQILEKAAKHILG